MEQSGHKALAKHETTLAGGANLTGWMQRVLLAACALTLVSCVAADSESGDPTLTSSWVRPLDPQEQIGAREHPLVLARYGGAYQNPEAEKLIAVIVGKLVAVSDDPNRVYKITLLNSPKVNAFALPGGFLYVTRGLLALASDSSELAAVIAHEMAHVASNHAVLRKERESGAALGEQVVSEVLGGSAAGQIALAANKIRLSRFSQDQELQADAVGIRMIGRAGYDPFAASRFLTTMNAYRSWLAGGKIEDSDNLMSSHPSTPKRIELARRHARFFGSPGVGEKGRERYLTGVDGLLFGDTAEEGFVRGRTFSHTGLGITFKAPKGFKINNQPNAVMVTGPGEVATRFDAAVLSERKGLSDYLNSGWISGLKKETIREELHAGMRSATAVAAGEGWRFRVRILRDGSQLYRFITAAPQTSTTLDQVSKDITSSFRRLSPLEAAQLQPLKVSVIKTGFGQTQKSMIRKMKGVNDPEALFRMMNGLSADDKLEAGQMVKIVTDR